MGRRRRYRILGAAGLAALLAAACGTSSKSVRTIEAPVGPAPSGRIPPAASGRAQVGLASFYSSHLSGHRTASGERYNPRLLTAAHRTLPLGTVLRVTRIDDGGRPIAGPIEVRVNDRGPYGGTRIIDLSLAAARALQMIRAGVVRVRLEVIAERR